MARRTRSRFVRPQPRTKIWIGSGVGQTTLVGSTKALISTLSAGALLLRPFTILRTRQEVFFASDQDTAIESPFGDYGKIVVTDTAAAIGVTAVPDPSSSAGDPDADWFVHLPMSDKVNSANAEKFGVAAGHHYQIDSKAMRKVGPDDNIVSMATMDSAFGAIIITHGRMLIQLH